MEESGVLDSAKQEAFAHYIVEGKNQTEAYKMAFDAENMKDSSIYVEAYRLVNNPQVALRIKQLKEELASRCLWSLEDSVKTLKKIVDKEDTQDKDAINAVKELNSMYGYKAAVKQEITGKDGKDLSIKSVTIVDASGLMLDNNA
jgi:phage terminase small subunit